MTMTHLVVLFLTAGAVALAVIDKALGQGHGAFPCTSRTMHWALRIYALATFNRAAVLVSGILTGHPREVELDIVFGAGAMCVTHVVLLALLLRSRLPHGGWDRLEARYLWMRRGRG